MLASAGPRKYLSLHRSKKLRDAATEVILNCGSGVRLQGFYSPADASSGSAAESPATGPGKKLVILIHGWLGGETSSYLLSAAAALYAQGYSVFRLNLRDHGNSQHLNKELFHSARLDEVVEAMAQIQSLHPYKEFYLGGNFALRIAAHYDKATTRFDKIAAICPVVDPVNAMQTITDAMWVYPWYFVKRWKTTLAAKLLHFPALGFQRELKAARTLQDLNAFFVPKHTPYNELNDYFNAYAVTGQRLAKVDVATHIIHSADDPVVSAGDLQKLAPSDNLTIEVTQYGGHCGFLKNFKMDTWVDDRLLELFN